MEQHSREAAVLPSGPADVLTIDAELDDPAAHVAGARTVVQPAPATQRLTRVQLKVGE